ncbi:MAG: hypothetical protein MJD61_14885 [Proteobacteria bacterium]|nr:hypothetical protein [Pseudomonadota bacterium]
MVRIAPSMAAITERRLEIAAERYPVVLEVLHLLEVVDGEPDGLWAPEELKCIYYRQRRPLRVG